MKPRPQIGSLSLERREQSTLVHGLDCAAEHELHLSGKVDGTLKSAEVVEMREDTDVLFLPRSSTACYLVTSASYGKAGVEGGTNRTERLDGQAAFKTTTLSKFWGRVPSSVRSDGVRVHDFVRAIQHVDCESGAVLDDQG